MTEIDWKKLKQKAFKVDVEHKTEKEKSWSEYAEMWRRVERYGIHFE